jgi:hypothetical protein
VINQFIKFLLLIILLLVTLSVLYYSWLPNPSFKTETYLPNSLIQWTEEHGILRTGVPFVVLSINFILLNMKRITPIKIFLILFTLLLVAEIGQIFLKYRHFDFMDIWAGIIAILCGLGIGLAIKKCLNLR